MKNYLKNLASRISESLRIRVGGNSLDGSVFNPTASKMLTFDLQSTKDGIKNIPVTFGPQVATTLEVSLKKIRHPSISTLEGRFGRL